MRSGDEPFVEVLLLHEFIRRKVVRTVVFAGDGVFGLFIQVALFGRLLEGMFVVCRLVLLYGWVCMDVVSVEAGLERRLRRCFDCFSSERSLLASLCSSSSLPLGMSTMYTS